MLASVGARGAGAFNRCALVLPAPRSLVPTDTFAEGVGEAGLRELWALKGAEVREVAPLEAARDAGS